MTDEQFKSIQLHLRVIYWTLCAILGVVFVAATSGCAGPAYMTRTIEHGQVVYNCVDGEFIICEGLVLCVPDPEKGCDRP